MEGEFNIQVCSHCNKPIKCWWTGLEKFFHLCVMCRENECEFLTKRTLRYTLCDACNWSMEDWYGHA